MSGCGLVSENALPDQNFQGILVQAYRPESASVEVSDNLRSRILRSSALPRPNTHERPWLRSAFCGYYEEVRMQGAVATSPRQISEALTHPLEATTAYVCIDSVARKGVRESMEEIRREELEEQKVELLPDREEMNWKRINLNIAVATAQQGAVAQANQGIFINK